MSEICRKLDFIECHIAATLWKLFSPLLLAVGIPGNILSIAVLSRQRMRHTTTSVYLRLLAIVDTAVLLVAIPRQLAYFYSSVKFHDLGVFSCKFFSFIIPTIVTLSWCFLPIITIDRFILVRYPVWAKKHCTKRAALTVFAILTSIIVVINSHSLLFLNIQPKHGTIPTNVTNVTVQISKVCATGTDWYDKFFDKVWPSIVFILFSLTPISIQIVFNILLARELLQRSRVNQNRRALDDVNANEQRELKSVTKMLITVSVFFVLSSLPQCSRRVLKPYIFKPETPQNFAKNLLFQCFVQLLLYSNNSINFLLYTLSGRQFRKELYLMLKHARRSLIKRLNRVVIPEETTLSRETTVMRKETLTTSTPKLVNQKRHNSDKHGGLNSKETDV